MKRIIIIFSLSMLVFGCQNKTQLDFKYSYKLDLFPCSGGDMDLVKEAVYAFEDYISENYAFLSKQVPEGYHNYIKLLVDDRAPARELFGEHLIQTKNYLREQDDLWVEKNGLLHLNYGHELVACIINNIENDELKQMIDALVSSNTVRPQLLAPTLFRHRLIMTEDRALATYIVFEFFYPKLFEMDSPDFIENIDRPKEAEKLFPTNEN